MLVQLADLGLVASSLMGQEEPRDELADSFAEGGINIWDDKSWALNRTAAREGPSTDTLGPNDFTFTHAAKGQDFLSVAEKQIGSPYVWADLNPKGPTGGPGAGFDCSGFTKFVLGKFGINVPHQARQQMAMLPNIKRDELQPGDLVFFDYGRLGAGVADDVKIYVGNGQVIGASSSFGKVTKLPLDEAHFLAGGRTGLTKDSATRQRGGGRKKGPGRIMYPALEMVGANVSGAPSSFEGMGFSVGRALQNQSVRDQHPSMRGDTVKQQLYEGFMAAGREDLARMVNTKAFQTWIQAESGWDPKNVSQYYDGKVNGGLFQFRWFDERKWLRPFFSDGNDPQSNFTASPYEQAILVSKYFDLTPEDIRRYASQVQSGTYGGWG